TATAAALLGLECEVYMGAEDVERQALNVFRMRLLGARVTPVETGSRTLKDAINEALRDWVTNVRTTYYLLGSALGPHPYPVMVRDFHAVIGKETRSQARKLIGRLPDVLVACVGGGSNAIGLFHPFVGDRRVRIVGVEAGGHGIASGQHGASLSAGRVGVLHGCMTYLLQSDDGQIATAHSISAGLDYPGVGPEHAYYKDSGRFEFVSVTDEEALDGFQALARLEGIMPALESAHAVAYAMQLAKTLPRTKAIVVGLSGRGDKDVQLVAKALGQRARGAGSTRPPRDSGSAGSARWWLTSPPAILHSKPRAGSWSKPSAAAPTSWSWGCRSPTHSPMGPSSSGPLSARSPAARR